ncbi:hypothetical protein O53_344 [Microcystis aeruginosa TAIHU98]|uniref:Uncharacterized protein n=1 Tax=Microcystis aeruginosa TAIHU98 TaxID=1134457 RepID=L7E8F3_MICAE|nr:hypothetical protein O53_344 [Microcystis aeruginosa TAIHU98]TRT65322.1 MAG: hypothetical protein EWV68_17640 [Microcystis sp. M_QC_C_20170808_M9Col]TRT67095.1 MAG: hypothetical protein EWV67_05025 [Microcystis sp. M_QC_C_20170808_M2Col]
MLKKFFLEVGDSDSGDSDSGDRRLFLFILPISPFPHFPISPFPHTPHPTPHTPHPRKTYLANPS